MIVTSTLPALHPDMSAAELETYIVERVRQRLQAKWQAMMDDIMINGTGSNTLPIGIIEALRVNGA